MGMRDCVYLVVAGLASIFFYLRGYHRAEAKARARRKLEVQVPYDDLGCLIELPCEDLDQVLRELQGERVTKVPTLTPAEIRATFGEN